MGGERFNLFISLKILLIKKQDKANICTGSQIIHNCRWKMYLNLGDFNVCPEC